MLERKQEELRVHFEMLEAEYSFNAEDDYLIVDARHSNVKDKDLKLLWNCSKLTYLNVEGCEVTNLAFPQSTKWPELRYLNIARTKCNQDSLQSILHSKNLSGLVLNGISGINNSHIRQLCKLEKLKLLDVAHTSITQTGIEDIIVSLAIDEICIDHHQIKFSDMKNDDYASDFSTRTIKYSWPDGLRFFLDLPVSRDLSRG
jgi:hypothetical protein